MNELLGLYMLLASVAVVVGAIWAVVALWRLMKAHESIAASMCRLSQAKDQDIPPQEQ